MRGEKAGVVASRRECINSGPDYWNGGIVHGLGSFCSYFSFLKLLHVARISALLTFLHI